MTMERQLLLLTIVKQALMSLICAATLLWLSWWTVSSEPVKNPKYFDRLPEDESSRFFRVDGKYGLVVVYQAFPFMLVAILSLGVVEIRKKINAIQGRRLDGNTAMKDHEDLEHPEISQTMAALDEASPLCPSISSYPEKSQTVAALDEGSPLCPSISSYPLLVAPSQWWWNPFGSVLTAAELLFVVGVLLLVLYSYGRRTHLDFHELDKRFHDDPTSFTTELWASKLSRASENLGRASLVPFALLWIPVSRGSPFLRLIGIPFEHAVKYHILLAMLTLTLLTGHAIGYFVYYSHTDSLYEIFDWVTEREKCSLVAGFIAWIVGLVMWATSLSVFRRRWYEFFFSIHHLYIVFFIFFLYHVIYTIHFFIVPCLLFMVDRFLRMLQSREAVDVLSAKVLESGAIQLRLAVSNCNAQGYHALSTWYIRFPSLSRFMKLQWHLFSVTSSSLDEKPELSIIIKPLGKWTTALQEQLNQSMEASSRNMVARCPFSFKAGVEGPYGDETDYFLRYKTLVLVGGGIGVTPLLAVLADILHRNRRGAAMVPSSIQLFYCVRRPEELCILNSVDPNKISPGYEKRGLHVRVSAFVTSTSLADYTTIAELMPDGPSTALHEQLLELSTFRAPRKKIFSSSKATIVAPCLTNPSNVNRQPRIISNMSTKGNSLWFASILLASMSAFYLLWGLSNVHIVKHVRADFPTNFNRVHILLACLLLATIVFGGFVSLLWWINNQHTEKESCHVDSRRVGAANHSPNYHHQELRDIHVDEESMGSTLATSPWNGTLQLGHRPIWSDVFNTLTKQYQGKNIGVLVSGPQSMQEDIARQCKRHTKLFDTSPSSNVFHYHSISFQL